MRMTGMKGPLLVLWLLWMVVVAALLMVCQLLLLMMVIVKATCLMLIKKLSLILFLFRGDFRKNRQICRKIAQSVAKSPKVTQNHQKCRKNRKTFCLLPRDARPRQVAHANMWLKCSHKIPRNIFIT
jgi:hypothetical protein